MKKASKRRPKASHSRKRAAAAASRAPSGAYAAPARNAVSRTNTSRPGKVDTAKRHRGGAVARPRAYGSDDRQTLAILLLPFILVAFAIGFSLSLRPGARPLDLAKAAPRPASPHRVLPPVVAVSPSPAVPVTIAGVTEPPVLLPQAMARSELASPPPAPTASLEIPASASEALAPPAVEAALLSPILPAPSIAPSVAAAPPLVALAAPEVAPSAHAPGMSAPVAGQPDSVIAAIVVPDLTGGESASTPPPATSNVCVADLPFATRSPAVSLASAEVPRDPAEFGAALANAALTQTREFVVYNDKYRRIAYPMGDVPSFYGVCTDVLIRAYRALSIDLQALVQQTRAGNGDPNIDHRRVDTLRRFFAAHGQSMPITEFAEDYRPGDIVSYWRPQNRHSRTHIAIVANEIGPSGRPMIIHNRGWGPQLEDGLFVDQITGHYRFKGLRAAGATAPLPAGTKPPPPARRAGLSRAAGIAPPLATSPATP